MDKPRRCIAVLPSIGGSVIDDPFPRRPRAGAAVTRSSRRRARAGDHGEPVRAREDPGGIASGRPARPDERKRPARAAMQAGGRRHTRRQWRRRKASTGKAREPCRQIPARHCRHSQRHWFDPHVRRRPLRGGPPASSLRPTHPPPPLPTRDATAWPPANGGWSSRPSTWWCAANGGLCSWEPPPTCRRTRREAPAAAWLGNPWVRVACGCYAPPPPNRRASREITRLWLPSTWYPPDTSPGARAVSTADGGSDRPLSSAALGGAGVSLFGEIPLHTVWVDRHTWSVEQPAPTCIASPEVSGTCMPVLSGAANHHLWSAIPEDCTTRTRWSTTRGSEGERGGGGRHKEPGPRLVPPTRRDGLGARSPAGARTKA